LGNVQIVASVSTNPGDVGGLSRKARRTCKLMHYMTNGRCAMLMKCDTRKSPLFQRNFTNARLVEPKEVEGSWSERLLSGE
jgi:hypothetical protein